MFVLDRLTRVAVGLQVLYPPCHVLCRQASQRDRPEHRRDVAPEEPAVLIKSLVLASGQVVDVTVDRFLDGHAVAVDRAQVWGQPVDLQRLGRADEVNHRPELLGVLLGLEGHRSLTAVEPEHDIPVARGVPARPLLDGRHGGSVYAGSVGWYVGYGFRRLLWHLTCGF